MLIHLKVKLVNLGAEAAYIKRLERRLLKKGVTALAPAEGQNSRGAEAFFSLRDHRKRVVRPHTRATHLAYAFLKGKRYRQVERDSRKAPDWKEALSIARRFGSVDEAAFKAWGEEKRVTPPA